MLAIAGGKGGVGKTTTTLGLAVALDGPVLAVDADYDMPNLHALAGIDAGTDPDAGGPIPDAVPHPNHAETWILPATSGDAPGDEDGDRNQEDVRRRLTRVRSAIGPTERVLVDCPAGSAPDAVAPLRVADGTVLVSTLCTASLRDAAKTAAMSRAVGTPVCGVVLTRTRLAPPAVSDLLGCSVLASVPDVAPPILEKRRIREAYGQLAVETQPKT